MSHLKQAINFRADRDKQDSEDKRFISLHPNGSGSSYPIIEVRKIKSTPLGCATTHVVCS